MSEQRDATSHLKELAFEIAEVADSLRSTNALRSDILHRIANKVLDASLSERGEPVFENLQDAPRVLRNTFTIQHDGKRADVVFASFAACIERENNSLRSVPSAIPCIQVPKQLVARLLQAHELSTVDWEAMRELRKLSHE